jgi:hypothetical protein
MKKLAIFVVALMFILGMNGVATAQLSGGDGTYEFYGTYSSEQWDADGNDPHTCTMALNGLNCPTTTNICIKNLTVTGGGTVIQSGDGPPHYGIAIGIMYGTIADIDNDGSGPVSLTVGPSSNDDMEQRMSVDEVTIAGPCGSTTEPCVVSLTTARTGAAGAANTVTGNIPSTSQLNPTSYVRCSDGGTVSYDEAESTTETVTIEVDNEFQPPNSSMSQTGSRLVGDHLVLKKANVRLRLTMLGITLGTDTMGFNTIEGTFCKGVGCTPIGFGCPAEVD